MLNKKSVTTVVVMTMLLSVLPLGAQNEAYNMFSPFTMFGIGDISKQGTAYNKSMGGVGIATRDKRNINYLNPAAVTEREQKSFMVDFGIAQGNRYYSQDGLKSAQNTCNIYDFVISFPVYKSFAAYAGFTPFSDLGYKVLSYETNPEIIGIVGNLAKEAQGYGGLSDIFIGGGITPFKGMSIGAEYQHIFGNIQKKYAQIFEKDSYRSIYSGYDMSLNADAVKFGIQYELPAIKSVTATIGATYRLSTNLKGTILDYEYGLISSVADTSRSVTTNLSKNKGMAKIASELGLGISLKGADKWTAEIDYVNSDWSSTGFDKVSGLTNVGNAVFSASSSQSFRAGFSIVPNRNNVRYYRKRITYRGGAYWDQAYCKVDGNDINAIGLTFGVTLPVYKWSNGITIGMEVGQRGYSGINTLKERYINFNLGLNIFDIWFIKPRYD